MELEWHVFQMQGTDITVLPCHSTEDQIWTKSALNHKKSIYYYLIINILFILSL